mgnify:CR=1 FL=1
MAMDVLVMMDDEGDMLILSYEEGATCWSSLPQVGDIASSLHVLWTTHHDLKIGSK